MTSFRWDDDERGQGVGDGRRLEPGAGELLEALREPGWVAEDGDDHLLPHLRRACERGAVPLRRERRLRRSVEDRPRSVSRDGLVLRRLAAVPQSHIEQPRGDSRALGEQFAGVERAGADLVLGSAGGH
jgi:hypothetical protein